MNPEFHQVTKDLMCECVLRHCFVYLQLPLARILIPQLAQLACV